VAGNIEALARRCRGNAEIAMISRSSRLLSSRPDRISRKVAASLERRGVMVSLACSVETVKPGRVACSDGRRPEFDILIAATGLRAPASLSALGLTLSNEGALLVRPTLQSVDDPRVFAAGDCADLQGHSLERAGVFAVRQAPVLLNNLAAFLGGGPLDEFRPQKRWLSILNLGGGEGLALWGRLSWQGSLALRLKDLIDRRFLERYCHA
jgi:NADH dehydrogenase FAD-containing subunit